MDDSMKSSVSQNTPVTGADNVGMDSGFPDSAPQASPSDFFPPPPPTSSSMPKNKIIATFLGMLLLVGGLGVGIVLVEQPQLLEQKAAPVTYCTPTSCDTTGYSCSGTGGICTPTMPGVCECIVSPACFLPGTKVATDFGTKNIEDITVNDKVLSFNDSFGNKINMSNVSNIFHIKKDSYFNIKSGNTEVNVTAEHPFYVGGGSYTEASKLKVGDTVYLLNNGQLVASSVTNIQRVNKQTDVYNLTVAGDHTYFANNYAVHNKYAGAPAPPPEPPTKVSANIDYKITGGTLERPTGGTVTIKGAGWLNTGWTVQNVIATQDTTAKDITYTTTLSGDLQFSIQDFSCSGASCFNGDHTNNGLSQVKIVLKDTNNNMITYYIKNSGTKSGEFTLTKVP